MLGNQSAIDRFNAMKTFNLAPVIAFAVRDGYLPDQNKAELAFDGLLQWLAAHAVDEHREKPFVMMNGQVDQAYHAFLLNSRTYLHFCREYIGFFIHPTPVEDGEAAAIEATGGIDYTVDYLRTAFGPDLAPVLVDWVAAHQRGELLATSVSCVSNGPDRAPHDMISIADFRTFWDTNPQTNVGTA